jgi:nucleosome binding factor SPN SPT16 subunit
MREVAVSYDPVRLGFSGVPSAQKIVARSAFIIAQNSVGFVQLLEPFFALRISHVAIGVILHSQLTVGPFDLLFRHIRAQAQDFIIVLHPHLSLRINPFCTLLLRSRAGAHIVLPCRNTFGPPAVEAGAR